MERDYNSQKRIEELYSFFKESVLARLKFLSSVSSLAATLLVVATFNNQLFELTCFVRFLISLLLFLIPLSIFFYLYELNETANKARKALEQELNKDLAPQQKTFSMLLGAYFPWVGLLTISFVIISIIILMWR